MFQKIKSLAKHIQSQLESKQQKQQKCDQNRDLHFYCTFPWFIVLKFIIYIGNLGCVVTQNVWECCVKIWKIDDCLQIPLTSGHFFIHLYRDSFKNVKIKVDRLIQMSHVTGKIHYWISSYKPISGLQSMQSYLFESFGIWAYFSN